MKITARYTTIIMLSIAVALLYSCRSLPAMTRPYLVTIVGSNVKNISGFVCEASEESKKIKPLTNLSEPIYQEHTMKIGYDCARAIAHVMSGLTCDRTGGRYIVMFSVFACSTLLILYPFFLTNFPSWGMLIYNIVTGSFSGYVMPAFMTLIASWSPLNRQTVFVGTVYAGGPISKILEYLIIEYFMVLQEHWQSVFHVFAILGFVYCLFFMYTVFSKPGMHPFISHEEKLFLQEQLGTKIPKKVPYLSIVRDSRMIAILFGKLSHLWIQNINQSYLPLYFSFILKINLRTKGGFRLIIPHLLHFICTITAAVLIQCTINKRKMQLTQVRVFCTMFGTVAPALMMLLMSFAKCNIILAQILSSMAICGMATMNLGVKSNILDLTSHFAGFCEAFANGIATLCVMALPNLMGSIITSHDIYEWRSFYWITLAFTSFLATIHYMFVGVERAKWDHIPVDSYIIHENDRVDTNILED